MTMDHSNLIESLWHVLKYYIKHIYGHISGTEALEDFPYEAKFRRDIAALPLADRMEIQQVFV